MDNDHQEKLGEIVAELDGRAHDGRVERLALLQTEAETDMVPMPALAAEYYAEARLAWYVGAFVAAIVMAQLALEELFRSHYRAARGLNAKLPSGVAVDKAGFLDLLNQARVDGFLTNGEFDELDHIRKTRNPYVHSKDEGGRGPSFFEQLLKISAPELIGATVEVEAKKIIGLLLRAFPVLCMRSWGVTHKAAQPESA